MSVEAIERAAIRVGAHILSVPRPCRHHHAIWLYVFDSTDQPTDSSVEVRSLQHLNFEQGFVTSVGRFVNRVEAKRIAVASGQYRKQGSSHARNCAARGRSGDDGDELFSEDVW